MIKRGKQLGGSLRAECELAYSMYILDSGKWVEGVT
jgi:hypothetical protein